MARIVERDEWKAHIEVDGQHKLYGDGTLESAEVEAELLEMLGYKAEVIKIHWEVLESHHGQ